MSRPGTPSVPSFQTQQPPPTNPNNTRLMQVKVLYTFDDAKTNCLARCPHPVPVRTAMLDASTEVGIIELRACVQAIVSASPELVAKLGHDFTIYAYDYSEYETPLVGQGMLSWLLASSSATPTAPALESTTPVTGRVTRGGLNLFSTGAAVETLEVKLKLVPVPTSLQSDYLESMQKYRDASNFATQGVDAAAWNDFVQTNPNFTGPAPGPSHQQPSHHYPAAPHQAVHQQSRNPYGNTSPAQSISYQSHQLRTTTAPSSRPASRPSTPNGKRTGRQSRQSSRPSSTRDRPTIKRSSSFQHSEPAYADQLSEFPSEQPRKRARVEQASWHGPSTLAVSKDSLRVAASTAASIRGHVLPAANPTTAQIAAQEPPAPPPTPRPSAPRPLRRTNTSLAHDAIMHRPHRPSGLAGGSLTDNEESVATSPESRSDSASSTPVDIPSSPPLMGYASMDPSSPMLPKSAGFVDSGFGSSVLDDLFDDRTENADLDTGENEVKAAGPSRKRAAHAPVALTSELSITEEVPGDPKLLPQKVMLTKKAPKSGVSRQPPQKGRAESVAMSSPSLPPHHLPDIDSNSTPLLTTEEVPLREDAQDQDYAPARPMHDPQEVYQVTGLPPLAPQPPGYRRDSIASVASPAVEPTNSTETSAPVAMSADAIAQGGSGVQRRKAIRSRLESDLSKGKLPPYCKNCGEIETPTWRKCFVRTVQGAPPDFNPHAGLEGYIGREIVDRNESGEVQSHRIIRRNITKGEKDWEELKLCNSCGMWLFRFKSMRPQERWGKGPKSKGQGRKKPVRSKSAIGPGEPQSDAGSPIDNEGLTPYEPELPQSNNEPFRAGGPGSDYDAQRGSVPRERSVGIELERRQIHSVGSGLDEVSAAAALQRAIQSSPPKFPGSQATPIDLDEDKNNSSVRRLLFPSPRRKGHMKTLDGSESAQAGTTTVTVSGAPDFAGPTEHSDKENFNPSKHRRPTTPSAQPTQDNSVFKTPLRRASTRTGLTPNGASPGGTALRRSPRFASNANSPAKNPMTPFTATMNQMMSDPMQSPTNFSDQFNIFADTDFGDAANTFDFTDFDKDGYATDMPIPPSDADYFPVMNDFEFNSGSWYGGPLLDGELDALLADAGDDACETSFAAIQRDEGQSGGVHVDASVEGDTPRQLDDGQGPT